MKNHDYESLHEYPEFGATTGKGKKSSADFVKASSDEINTHPFGGKFSFRQISKVFAMGTVTAIAVTGAVVAGDDALSDGLEENLNRPPISQNSVDPKDLIHSVHTWDAGVIVLDPSCTESGTVLYSCTGCDETYTEFIAPTGHKPEGDGTGIAPTCTEEGRSDNTVCTVCGEILEEAVPIDPTGHTPGEAVVSREPTCTEGGRTEAVTCEVCGEVLEEAVETEPLGHDWGDFTVTKAPTCTAAGIRQRTCARCETTQSESVARLGHIDAGGDYRCDRCGAALVSIALSGVHSEAGSPLIQTEFSLSSAVRNAALDVVSETNAEWKMLGASALQVLFYPTPPDATYTVRFTVTVTGTDLSGKTVTVLTRSYSFVYGPEQYWGDQPISVK